MYNFGSPSGLYTLYNLAASLGNPFGFFGGGAPSGLSVSQQGAQSSVQPGSSIFAPSFAPQSTALGAQATAPPGPMMSATPLQGAYTPPPPPPAPPPPTPPPQAMPAPVTPTPPPTTNIQAPALTAPGLSSAITSNAMANTGAQFSAPPPPTPPPVSTPSPAQTQQQAQTVPQQAMQAAMPQAQPAQSGGGGYWGIQSFNGQPSGVQWQTGLPAPGTSYYTGSQAGGPQSFIFGGQSSSSLDPFASPGGQYYAGSLFGGGGPGGGGGFGGGGGGMQQGGGGGQVGGGAVGSGGLGVTA